MVYRLFIYVCKPMYLVTCKEPSRKPHRSAKHDNKTGVKI